MLHIRQMAIAGSMLLTGLFTAPADVAAEHRRGGLEKTAYKLAKSAEYFHEQIHDRPRFSHLDRSAHKLARAAARFCESVERGASPYRLRADLDRVKFRAQYIDEGLRHVHPVRRGGHGKHADAGPGYQHIAYHGPPVRQTWHKLKDALYRANHELEELVAYRWNPHRGGDYDRVPGPRVGRPFPYRGNFIRIGDFRFFF